MALLYVTEYASVMQAHGNVVPVPMEPPLADYTVDYSGGAAASAAFNAKTTFVRIETDAICSVLFGANPTAAATNGRLSAGDVEWRAVPPGQSFKVSAISNT